MGKGDDPNCVTGASMPAPEGLSGAGRRALADRDAARDLLLSRDEFRAAVFARDGGRCVVCGRDRSAVKLDAHHLMERRLFGGDDPRPGGYVLANGVSLCDADQPDGRPSCHRQAEMTVLSPDQLREAARIEDVVLPDHLEAGEQYEKWGGVTLPDGRRYRGELFYDEPVQKMLAAGGVKDLYLPSIKYPRSYHLPFSPGASNDDKVLSDTSHFDGREVVILEKIDGENATLSRDIYHARSLDSGYHPGRTWVKRLWSQVRWELPEGWRICGENMQALHTVPYRDLPGHLLVFSIWNEKNEALSWDDTQEWCELLGLPTVPVLYRGVWDEDLARELAPFPSRFGGEPAEGFVVRVADSFRYRDFRRSLAKWVVPHFVTGEHWSKRDVIENQLAADATRI